MTFTDKIDFLFVRGHQVLLVLRWGTLVFAISAFFQTVFNKTIVTTNNTKNKYC